MKTLLVVGWMILVASSSLFAGWTSTPPSSVQPDQGYSMSASNIQYATVVVVYIFKNGAQVAGNSSSGALTNRSASASYSSSDSGPQSITYRAEDWASTGPNGAFVMNGSSSTTTNVAQNYPPSASLTGDTSLAPNTPGMWTFSVSDSNANLKRWRFYFSTNPNPQWTNISGSSASGTYSNSWPSGCYTFNLDVEDLSGATASASLTVCVKIPTSFSFTGGPGFIFNGSTRSVSVTPNPSGATYSTSGTYSAVNVGNYTASATATGDYTGSGSYGWSIAPASTTFSFGGATYTGGVRSVSVFPNPSGASYSLSGTSSATNVGSYNVTATATGNYTGSTSGTWTISPAPTSFTFGGGTYTGATRNVTINASPAAATYAISGTTSATNVGTYNVTATANGNYTGSTSGTWTISPAPVSFSFSGATYDGGTKNVSVSINPSGATYTLSGSPSATNAGTYSITATATGNYTGSTSGTWTIARASQAAVSSSNAAGSTNTAFTPNYSGGSGTGSWQWYVSGQTSWSSSSWTPSSAGTYTFYVRRLGDANYNDSSASAGYTLTVSATPTAPTITAGPVSQTVNAGQNATFSVTASGTPAPTYQWRKGGVDIPGANATSYLINTVQPSHAGSYTVYVSNSVGSTTSNTATLTVNTAPAFTTHPQNQSVAPGGTATFTATATGTPTPTYQWRKDGVNISGATSASHTISNAQATHAGSYTVVATNSVGSATSNPGTLSVNTPQNDTNNQNQLNIHLPTSP